MVSYTGDLAALQPVIFHLGNTAQQKELKVFIIVALMVDPTDIPSAIELIYYGPFETLEEANKQASMRDNHHVIALEPTLP